MSDEPQLTTFSSVTSDGEEYLIRNIISRQKEDDDIIVPQTIAVTHITPQVTDISDTVATTAFPTSEPRTEPSTEPNMTTASDFMDKSSAENSTTFINKENSNATETSVRNVSTDYGEYNSGDYYEYPEPVSLPLIGLDLTLVTEQRLKCYSFCNNHSTSCFELENETFCSACLHNTQGRKCNICNPGYFRDKSKSMSDVNVCQKVRLPEGQVCFMLTLSASATPLDQSTFDATRKRASVRVNKSSPLKMRTRDK